MNVISSNYCAIISNISFNPLKDKKSPEFWSLWTIQPEEIEAKDKPLHDIFSFIGLFWDYQRLINVIKGKTMSTFFTSLKD